MDGRTEVSAAQVRQAIEAVEAMGRRVSGIRVWPDGRTDVLIAEDAPQEPFVTLPRADEDHSWEPWERFSDHRADARKQLEESLYYMDS